MKRILIVAISFLMVVAYLPHTVFAETTDGLFSVPVEYSSQPGKIEYLDTMINDGHVYADAEMLGEQLGYQTRDEGDFFRIFKVENDTFSVTKFYYDSTKVAHSIFCRTLETYQAPCVTIKNEEGIWIPLEYSLLVLNSGCMVLDDTLLIDTPVKTIPDYFAYILRNHTRYTFEFEKDFGYTESNVNWIGTGSHLVNQFNGLIGWDGAAWKSMFQSFILDSSAYDEKYGEDLALLLCGASKGELNATVKRMGKYADLLNEKGKLGTLLSEYSISLDSEVNSAYVTCEKILREVEKGNAPASIYNKSYQILEDALDKQTWFSRAGGNIMEVQKRASDTTAGAMSVLNIGSIVMEVVGYGNEFANHDQFSQESLRYFLRHATMTDGISAPMQKSMTDYMDSLEKTMAEYATERFFNKNVNKWIVDALSIPKALGTQANAVLFVWDLASNTIPFIANGISAANQFELALYATIFQSNALVNYSNERNTIFNDEKKITAANLYQLSKYCYLYLKSCYTAREAALGSLEGKREALKKEIQPLIEEQKQINSEIADMMTAIKEANGNNENLVYGFLPKDNEKYLDEYDDSKLLKICTSQTVDADEANLIWKEFIDSESYINYIEDSKYLEGGLVPQEYVIADLNADELPELLLQATNDAPFYATWVFVLNQGEVALADETYGYGMFRYSASQNAVLISPESGPMQGTASVPFYRLEGSELDYVFQIGEDRGQYFYSDSSGQRFISEAERDSYFSDVAHFEWEELSD